jgi:glycosyltransferase involved in cell wall biosynthesis
MRILSITAGAANMYCGSCLRDNALAAELIARGHDVTLMPMYTPTVTDEPNISAGRRVLFGGISVYLQQHVPVLRHTPRVLDWLWDAAPVIRAFAGRSMKTDPKTLGELTVSMLEGEHGHQKKEFVKLLDWLREEPLPDVVNLPNSLLIALAGPMRRALNRPVCVTMQGEDLFLDGLQEPYRSRSIALIRRQLEDVDLFIAVSEFYVDRMASYLGIPKSRTAVVPLGISLKGYDGERPARSSPPRVGYFARVAPEKGLHELCEAYRILRQERGLPDARLEVAGWLGAEHREYLAGIEASMRRYGLASEFHYRGVLDREQKIAFLRSLDVMSVPGPFPDPKGLYLLEAMATGTPVVQPRRGAYPEVVERTGGGLIVDEGPEALADGLSHVITTAGLAASLGRRGAEGVRRFYSVQRSADRLLEVYAGLADQVHEPALGAVSSSC